MKLLRNFSIFFIMFTLCVINVKAYNSVFFTYDNDMLFNTDYYYSQGINFGFSSSSDSTFLNCIFPNLYSNRITTIALNHKIYTPTNITASQLEDFDRPYASLLYLDVAQSQFDKNNEVTFDFKWSVGLLGPYSFGKEIQTFIHQQSKNAPIPKGWEYQLSNFPILNLNAKVLRGNKLNNYFENMSIISLQAGTLMNSASIGSKIRIGILDDFYLTNKKNEIKNKLYIYTDTEAMINLVLYNTLLLGNFINEKSPMVLEFKKQQLLTYELSTKLVAKYNSNQIIFAFNFISKEFENARKHAYFSLQYSYFI